MTILNLEITRWGQTPLSEAILFKHTKIASVLKRHDRMLKTLNSGNEDTEDVGEALWRKLVQGKMMKTPKAKPIFKFDPSLVDPKDKKQKKKVLKTQQRVRLKRQRTQRLPVVMTNHVRQRRRA